MTPSSLRRAGALSALASVLASSCALLYDFEGDDGRGGSTATSNTATGTTVTDASNATTSGIDVTAATASGTNASSGSGGWVEGAAVLVGSPLKDESAQRGLAWTELGPALGLYLDDSATIVDPLTVDNAFGAVATRLDRNLEPVWADLSTDSSALFSVTRGVREVMVASLDGGRFLLGGTTFGPFTPNDKMDPEFPAYRTAHVTSYNALNGTVADTAFLFSVQEDAAAITLDGLTSDMNGGALIGYTAHEDTDFLDCGEPTAVAGVTVVRVNGALACTAVSHVANEGDYMVDLQPRPNGFTATLRGETTQIGYAVAFDYGMGGGSPSPFTGEMILAPGSQASQAYCLNNGDVIAFGRLSIDDQDVSVIETATWTTTKVQCNDIVPFQSGYLIAGSYEGPELVAGLGAAAGTDAFLLHVSADGEVLTARRIGGAGADRAKGIAVDPTGTAIYVSGTTSVGFDFAGMPLMSAETDAFVVRYDLTP